jgi:epimerase transport system membrane fusion protein
MSRQISGEMLEGEYEKKSAAPDLPQLETDHRRRSRLGILVVILTFIGFGGWATLAPVDGAAVAVGEVIVSTQNRVIQHLEGGVVDRIYVDDGDRVQQGDILVELSDVIARSELEIIQSQLLEILGEEARLLAERADKPSIQFPERLTSQSEKPAFAAILEGQQSLFESRRDGLQARLDILNQGIDALNQQIQGQQAVSRNLSGRIASYEQEVAGWQELYDRQLADRTRINEMERELLRLKADKDSTKSEIGRLRSEISSTRSELLVTKEEFMEKMTTRLREVQQKKADLMARETSLQDTLSRLVIKAPVTGTVVGNKVYTEGGVVKPGDTLMQVVPFNLQLAIKARVAPTEIDRISPGQKADVRLSAFNFQAAHVIESEVVTISADTFEDENTGESYYEVRLRLTEQGTTTMAEQEMFLVPGMPAEVMISTGERTVLKYLLDPFIRLSEKAFRET